MKVLMTGATGFIGRALRRKIEQEGHDVRVLVRRSSAHKLEGSNGTEVVYGDILDSHTCLRAADGCNAVVHLVGIIREFPENGTTYEALHTEATYNIVNAARRMSVQRFVHMSALGTGPDAKSAYHRTKYEAEQIVQRAPMRWTIFRPSVVFSPGSEFIDMLVDLVHRPLVPMVDGGKALLQPVSLDNVTDAMARCLHMPETQGKTFELGGPDRISFADLVARVAEHHKAWMNTVKVSSKMMRPMVKILQRFKSFPLTVDQLIMLTQDNVCDPGPFQTTFGIELDSFIEALPALLAASHVKAA
jgi:uncharacterized protein YbjT (DUF2867 family)